MGVADDLNAAVRAARRAASKEERQLAEAYLAQLRNLLAHAVSEYRKLAGLGLTAAADWTPPTEEQLLRINVRTARIRGAQRRMLARLGGRIASVRGVDFDLTHPYPQHLLDQLGIRAGQISDVLREPVAHAVARGWAEGLSVPDTARLIQSSVKPQLGWKATMLARTDLIGLSNGGGQWAVEQVNEASVAAGEPKPIQTKRWLSSRDGRVRDTHAEADGQEVPIDSPYNVGGESLMYPGDPSGSNAETINCRCTELFLETPVQATPKQQAVMEGRSDLVNELVGANADTQAKWKLPSGEYAPERRALHRQIAEHFLSGGRTVAPGRRPQATFLSGGSGAGKSTVKKALVEQGRFPKNAVDIDPDAIKEMLPEYQILAEARDPMSARIAHEESSDIAKAIMNEAQGRRMNLVIDGTGDGNPGDFLKKIVNADNAGYDVDVVVVDIPTQEAVARAMSRAQRTGRFVPEEVIRDIHQKVALRFRDEWREHPSVKSWEVWANEDRPPKMIAAYKNGGMNVLDEDRFKQFLRKADESVTDPNVSVMDSTRWNINLNPRTHDPEAIEETTKALSELGGALPQRAIDKVKALPDGKLPVGAVARFDDSPRTLGRYYREPSDHSQPMKIELAIHSPTPGMTLMHEVGHYIDNLYAVERGNIYTSLDAWRQQHSDHFLLQSFRNFTRAVADTREFKYLLERQERYKQIAIDPASSADDVAAATEMVDHINYMISPVELWARAFAQYMVETRGGSYLKDELRRELDLIVEGRRLPGQWLDSTEVNRAVEQVLRDLGLLEEKPPLTGSGQIRIVTPRLPARLPVRQELRRRRRVLAVSHEFRDDLRVRLPGEDGAAEVVGLHDANGSSVEWREDAGRREVPEPGRLDRGDPVRRRGVGRPRRSSPLPVRRGAAGGDRGGEEPSGVVPDDPREGGGTGARQARTAVAAGSRLPTRLPFPGDEREAAMSVVEAEVEVGAAWVSDLAFEGVSTGDGRFIVAGALGHRDLPLTLMAMVETPGEGGHAGAQVAGRIDAITKDKARDMSGEKLPSGAVAVRGGGVFDVGEFGMEIERMVDARVLTGVSVDMAINEWQFRDPATGDLIDPEEATDEQWEQAFLGEMEMAITSADIMAATVCATPAFADAKIALVAAAQPFRNLWRDADGQLCTTVFSPLRLRHDEALTAGSAAPLKPPRDWFFTPEPDRVTPLTITDEGRIYGHIAAWGSCHTGFLNGAWSECVQPPASKSGYAYFHVGEMPTAEGDLIPIGKMMLAESHAPTNGLGVQGTRAHYDRTGSVGAYVRAVDGIFGVWVSGCLSDKLTDEQRRDLHANPPSGDWRAVDRSLELIATLAVPVPGYPIPRTQVALAASADGDMYVTALILTGAVDVDYSAEAEALAAAIEGGGDALHDLIAG